MNLMTALEAIHGSLQIFFFSERNMEIWNSNVNIHFIQVQLFTVKNTEWFFFQKQRSCKAVKTLVNAKYVNFINNQVLKTHLCNKF